MEDKTRLMIIIILLVAAMLVSHFVVGRSAFRAGGRLACYNTNEKSILMEGFRCSIGDRPLVNISKIPEIDLGGGNLE